MNIPLPGEEMSHYPGIFAQDFDRADPARILVVTRSALMIWMAAAQPAWLPGFPYEAEWTMMFLGDWYAMKVKIHIAHWRAFVGLLCAVETVSVLSAGGG